VMSVLVGCICNSVSVFSVPRGGKFRAHANQVNWLGSQNRAVKLVHRSDFTQSRFNSVEDFMEHPVVFSFIRARALDFLVKKNFSSRLKIKFFFFLSVSKLISSLKPAGEQPQSACE
jgi:hypothetical protein